MSKKPNASHSATKPLDSKSTRRRDRRAHLRSIQTPAGMRAAALTTSKRRGTGTDHEHVIGGFRLSGQHVVLAAVECGPALDIHENTLTTIATRFARWRTKQAAWSWLQLRPQHTDLRVIHLGRLDVLAPDPR
jgi:hypothetical protein